MANVLNWQITSVSADRKTVTLVDNSTYDTTSRDSFTDITVEMNHRFWNQTDGVLLDIVQDQDVPENYTVRLEGEPHNGDALYWLAVTYDPVTGIFGETGRYFIITPNSEYAYSNMISELSEECCSVDFRMDRIKDLLLVGCLMDSIFVIKDRMDANYAGNGGDFTFSPLEAERLIRRVESIIE